MLKIMTSPSFGSSIPFGTTRDPIKVNLNDTQDQHVESLKNTVKTGRNSNDDEMKKTELVGEKRKSSVRKMSHEERLQINRDTAKETRRRKKEELEELRRIIISNSRETQQFRRNNEMLLKENQLLKKQNLLLQEELAQSRNQSLLRGTQVPQFNNLSSMGNSLLNPRVADALLALSSSSSSNDRNSFLQQQNLLNELVLLQRASNNGNVPTLNNDLQLPNSLGSISQSDVLMYIANSQFQDISQQQQLLQQQSRRNLDKSCEKSSQNDLPS